MDTRSKAAFLALVAVQAAHSLEECELRLYEVFAPARLVGGWLGPDVATGFLIGNVAIVVLGLACYFLLVRPDRPPARACAWAWAVGETVNAVTHLVMCAVRAAYFPGAATAPLLLAISAYLMLRLRSRR